MYDQADRAQFKSGLWLCWGSLLLLPVGLLAIGGGPCAGPRNALGSAILLGIGLACLAAAVYGIARIIRHFRGAANLMRLIGAASVCGATLGAVGGGLYLLVGIISLEAFLRY
jgi:hypothetical protein